jgi:TetR/AcrR family transcriptional regulator, transcriptional repressor for nem operon
MIVIFIFVMYIMIRVKSLSEPVRRVCGEKMKVSKAKAAEHRKDMLEAASRLFRERGFDGIGIPEIASAAGLTHGAFYTHFASKDAICAEAIEEAIGHAIAPIEGARGSRDALGRFVNFYLSTPRVADRGGGCPIAALSGDVPRRSAIIGGAFERALRRLVDSVASLFPKATAPSVRQTALATTAMLVGAVILARAVGDQRFRDEILEAARAVALKGRMPEAR